MNNQLLFKLGEKIIYGFGFGFGMGFAFKIIPRNTNNIFTPEITHNNDIFTPEIKHNNKIHYNYKYNNHTQMNGKG
jgi:hypothetical protein